MTQAHAGPRRPGREIPQFYREVVNRLIDQGWRYEPRSRTGGLSNSKPKLIPSDPTARIMSLPNTPSDQKGWLVFFQHLRQAGANLDFDALDRQRREARQRRNRRASRSVTPPVNDLGMTSIQPISTVGTWWHPAPQPELPLEAPEKPAEAPSRPVRRTGPSLDPDARGEAYTLRQARAMIRQGYHINKVIARTGWGRNWLSDMVDETGFLSSTCTFE